MSSVFLKDQPQKPVLNKTDPPSAVVARLGVNDDKGDDTSDGSGSYSKLISVSKNDHHHRVNASLSSTSINGKTRTLRPTLTDSAKNESTRQTGTLSSTGRIDKQNQTSSAKRNPKLLKEMTMWNRQNCLAKLLCGVQVAQPPTKSSSALNDYAYLVKAFFDRFSIRGIVTDALDAAFTYETDTLNDDEQDDEDEEDDEEKKKKHKKVSGKKKPENYNPKYYHEYDKKLEDLELEDMLEEDDVPDFYTDMFRRRHGRNMTHVAAFKGNTTNGKNETLAKSRRRRNVPISINRIRRKRGILGAVRRGFMGFFNPRFDKTSYLNKRQLELESTGSGNEGRQLNIAEEVAARIRSPRQCRLLNWFGGSNSNSNPQPPMTTTITTITTPSGGVVSMPNGLEKLNGIANLAMSAGSASPQPGSQVVTVIQQTPGSGNNGVGGSTGSFGDGSFGSTICPFNVQELQDLIMKAQGTAFPHFLTTTTPKPTNSAPISTSTTKLTPSNLQATKSPPPKSTTLANVVGQKNAGNSRHSQGQGYIHGDFNPRPTAFGSETFFPPMVPSVGLANEDDEGDFESDPYVMYKHKNEPSLSKHTTTLRKNATPVPKWKTTTLPPKMDDYYRSYNDLPIYSYGSQTGGYKVDKSKPETDFHSPPVVVDSGLRYKNAGKGLVQGAKPIKNATQSAKKAGKQAKKPGSGSEEDSSEKDEESAEGQDDDGSEEEASDSLSAGSRETRSGIPYFSMGRQVQTPKASPVYTRSPPPPTPLPHPVEGSEETDTSNEADERREDEEDSSGEEEEEQGRRSYEQNDFSKDRGGPQLVPQAVHKKPDDKNISVNSSKGFLSNLFNSFSSFRSFFKRNEKKQEGELPKPSPIPPRPQQLPAHGIQRPISWEESDEQEGDDISDDESAEETSNKEQSNKPLKPKTNNNKKPVVPSPPESLVNLKRFPVTIEDADGWVKSYHDSEVSDSDVHNMPEEEQDDSGDETDNPVENYYQALRDKHKPPGLNLQNILLADYDVTQEDQSIDNTRYMSGFPVSSEKIKNEWSSDLQMKDSHSNEHIVQSKETESEEDDADEDGSEESREESEDRLLQRRFPPPFIPEPID